MGGRWVRPLLVLVVVAALALLGLLGPGMHGLGAQEQRPEIRAVELSDNNTVILLATSAGLLRADPFDLKPPEDHPANAYFTIGVDHDSWESETIAGERNRSITDVESLNWRSGDGEQVETLFAVSEGVTWVRSDEEWSKLPCPDSCPSIDRLSNTFDANDDANQQVEGDANLDAYDDVKHSLLAIGEGGVWMIAPDRIDPDTDWQWVELESEGRVFAVAQDVLGRVWAVSTTEGGPEVSVYNVRNALADGDVSAVNRALPGARLQPAADAAMTSDSRGGMWIGLPDGVLWMDPDLGIRERLNSCELGVSELVDEVCDSEPASHTVMSVDNDLADVWVGTPAGLARVSVGERARLAVSTPLLNGADNELQVVSTARNLSGGDVWVATASQLTRVGIDRWSTDSQKHFEAPITFLATDPADSVFQRVLVGTSDGVWLAHWDEKQLILAPDTSVHGSGDAAVPIGIEGIITDHSLVTEDGAIFIATTEGVTKILKDGATELLAEFRDQRVSAIGQDGESLYVGTDSGLFKALVGDATEAGAFSRVDEVPKDTDVSVVWTAMDREFIGTAGRGLISTGADLNRCGAVPDGDAVIRSATSTSDESFVMVSSGGVYYATSDVGSDFEPECDVVFERFDSSGANTATGAEPFENTVAAQAAERSRLVWTGSDYGIDLVAWPGTWNEVDERVTTHFSSSDFFDGGRVIALASVGTGTDTTLIVGTNRGIFYHSPAQGQPRFSAHSLIPLDEKGISTVVDETRMSTTISCFGTDGCRREDLHHETRSIELDLRVDDLADADQFQFIVNDQQSLQISDRSVQREVERGQNYKLTITALDRHLHRSADVVYDISVKDRTLREWFFDTNAKWIALLILVAILGALIGDSVLRRLRRINRQDLRDLEIAMVGANDQTRVVVRANGEPLDDGDRVIATADASDLWKTIRTDKSAPSDIEAIGSVLWDQLISPPTEHDLGQARLGKRDVRLRLRGLDDELDALPWESVRNVEGGHIARSNTSIVRDLRNVGCETRTPTANATSELSDIAPGSSEQTDVRKPLGSLVPGKVQSIFGAPKDGLSSDLPEAQRPIRILLIVAEPDGRGRIAGADVEQAAIEQAAKTKFRLRRLGTVQVLSRREAAATGDDSLHPTPENLTAMLGTKPGWDFVHIIAHGEHTGRGPRIWLEDEDGDPVRMEADELCDLLSGAERGIRPVRLVVLNTCMSAGSTDSGFSASSLAVKLVRTAGVPAVVGMAMEIQTDAAKKFTSGFYRTAMRHGQVDYAMLVARREIPQSDPNWLAPRLYVGTGASDIFGGG